MQYLRSTDLPSLLTQSSILVLRPIPHTALALNWQVLQSKWTHTYTHTQISPCGFSLNYTSGSEVACVLVSGWFEDTVSAPETDTTAALHFDALGRESWMKSEQMEEAAPVMIQTLEWLIHVNSNSKQYEKRKSCVDNAQTRRTKNQQAARNGTHNQFDCSTVLYF